VTIQSENGGTATGNLLTNDVVSANMFNGIILSGTGTTANVVSGTIIGSDATGAAVVDDPGNALGNGQYGGGGSGVVINGGASLNTIGGTTAASRDVILGNKSYGVLITDGETHSNIVEGDVIGTDITGKVALGNRGAGVLLFSPSSTNPTTANTISYDVISGNKHDGVWFASNFTNDNQVANSFIVTDPTGTIAVPDGGNGINSNSSASNNDTVSDVIANNGGFGVLTAGGSQNLIAYDSIFSNATGGISEQNDPTPELAPPITGVSVSTGGLTTISGYLNVPRRFP